MLTALALLAAAGGLAQHFFPSSEAVRVRNAFLFEGKLPANFDWRPPAVPAGFRQQFGPAPAPFRALAAAAGPGSSVLQRATFMINRLNPGRRRGQPIMGSTTESLRVISETGMGYCSDYTQVMNGLAWAAGIPVREWGVSFDGFGGRGHGFNEFYAPALRKWVMVDPFNGFWARDTRSGMPLSAIEFRDRLRLPEPLQAMELVRIAPPPAGFLHERTIVAYYRQGVDQFYLWWGNNVFDYDAHPAVRVGSTVSRSLEQLAAIFAGVHPRIRVLPTPTNATMLSELERTRERVLTLAAACAALTILVLIEFRRWRRTPRCADETAARPRSLVAAAQRLRFP
jgi:hypothetical protein